MKTESQKKKENKKYVSPPEFFSYAASGQKKWKVFFTAPSVHAERVARRERDTSPATENQRSEETDVAGELLNDSVESPHPTMAAQHPHAADF